MSQSLGAAVHAFLGEYVYALEDPRDGVLFYVGRGSGDRVLRHARDALAFDEKQETTAKLHRIREILDAGLVPKAYVLRRQLGTRGATSEIEATVIDVLLHWKVPLTNLIRGHGTECGIRTLESICLDCDAEPLDTNRPAIVVNIGRTWFEGMSMEELWDAARKWWLCRPEQRKPQPNLLLAVAQGIIRGAWTVDLPPSWQIIHWSDLDERRRMLWSSEAEFEPFGACSFDGGRDWEWDKLVGRHTRHLPRSYGREFRYLNC